MKPRDLSAKDVSDAEDLGDVMDRSSQEQPCAPGSIEQQLDMCETGPLRGDEQLHVKRETRLGKGTGDPKPLDPEDIEINYAINMSEEGREGDDMSGDEHSSGLQGGEQELETQPHLDSGLPGDYTKLEEANSGELLDQVKYIDKNRKAS